MRKFKSTLLFMAALLMLCSCSKNDYSWDKLEEPSIINSDDDLQEFRREAYRYFSDFITSISVIDSMRFGKKSGKINADSKEISQAWDKGYIAIRYLNTIGTALGKSDKYSTYLTGVYALKAFVYYNMAMLWGNIVLIKQDSDPFNLRQVPASVVYEYCQELLNKCDLSHNVESERFGADAIKLLMAEIALTQKDKEKALGLIYSISDMNKTIFAFKSENGTIPIYTNDFIALLKGEAEGKANSQAWYNRGMSYGVWAALKRQGTAQQYVKCKDYELLLPIPRLDCSWLNIKQNNGY